MYVQLVLIMQNVARLKNNCYMTEKSLFGCGNELKKDHGAKQTPHIIFDQFSEKKISNYVPDK